MNPVVDEEQPLPERQSLPEIGDEVGLRVDDGDHDAEVLREDLRLDGAAPRVLLAYPVAVVPVGLAQDGLVEALLVGGHGRRDDVAHEGGLLGAGRLLAAHAEVNRGEEARVVRGNRVPG